MLVVDENNGESPRSENYTPDRAAMMYIRQSVKDVVRWSISVVDVSQGRCTVCSRVVEGLEWAWCV